METSFCISERADNGRIAANRNDIAEIVEPFAVIGGQLDLAIERRRQAGVADRLATKTNNNSVPYGDQRNCLKIFRNIRFEIIMRTSY